LACTPYIHGSKCAHVQARLQYVYTYTLDIHIIFSAEHLGTNILVPLPPPYAATIFSAAAQNFLTGDRFKKVSLSILFVNFIVYVQDSQSASICTSVCVLCHTHIHKNKLRQWERDRERHTHTRVHAQNSEMREMAQAFGWYVKAFLRKGVPSLFSDIKPLYKDVGKVQLMGELMEENLSLLRTQQKLVGEAEVDPPITILWVLEYLSNHYDRTGDSIKALAHINEALQYTPTVIDLHLTKARIFKHAGDLASASDECEIARKMDLADRFLNTVSTRYALRADRRQVAESTVALFTKDGDNPNNLFDMQCMWFEIEFGRSCLRNNLYGKALKKLKAVHTHFIDIIEDQFDFHTYCLRKMTLRAYITLLRCEDTIYKHKFFVRAALSLIETYVAIHDKPHSACKDEADPELEVLRLQHTATYTMHPNSRSSVCNI